MGRKWLDNYGQEENYNDSKISIPSGFVGQGYDISGRNYSPAWGGQFQMGGTLPGASGMMYSREVSNKPIVKVAQDGTNVDYSKLPYDENDIKGFYNKMISSPWYKNRLIKNGYDDQYSIGVDGVIKNRLKRVNDAKLDNIQKNDGVLNQMYRFITSGELIETGSGSYYNPDTGNITMVESQMNKHKAHPRTILAHEYGHPEVQGGISRIEEEMLSQFNPTPIKKLTEHDKKPSENKSDINSLRYNLYKAKIFDPSTGNYKTKSKKFEKSLFEKVKDDAAVKRLRNNYGDKQLINLINTVATNENNELIPIAKNGVIKDNDGYWNPNNWGKVVEIDSNDITMKGVNQPLLGISDEGDVQYMEPNKDYKFKGKKVTEYPIAQKGKSIKYSKLPYDVKDIKNFYDNMLSSPWYKERLINNGYGIFNPSLSYPETVVARTFTSNDKMEKEVEKIMSSRRKSIRNLPVYNNDYDSTSYYHDPNINYKEVNLNNDQLNSLKIHPRSALVHEIGHGEIDGHVENNSALSGYERELIKQNQQDHNTDQGKYVQTPEEAKGDINSIRYNLYKAGKFDVKTGKYKTNDGKFDKTMITPIKDDTLLKRMLDAYGEEGLMELMNKIAQNNNQDFIPIARNGINNLDENSLQQLDQLTNFTNYNKLSNGGWLDKF